MQFTQFFDLAGRRFEVRLQDACRLAGINYQTACNQRNRGVFPLPVTKRSRNNVVVKIDDLYNYIYPSAVVTAAAATTVGSTETSTSIGRRGKPRKEEVAEARARGLSVPQLRRRLAGLEG